MEPCHSDIEDSLDRISHDFRRHRRFFRDRQIARACAQDSNDSRALRQGLFLHGYAPGDLMVNGAFESLSERAGVFDGNSCDEHTMITLPDLGRDLDGLFGCLAAPKNNFREPFAQSAVCVHARESKIRHGRLLKGVQHFVTADLADPKFFE